MRNKVGLQPVHVAAQNDQAFALTFLKENGADMDCVDIEGQTPLHWACYQGADESIYYILAWTKALNLQDSQGKTALHLAVENVHRFRNLRALKEMLIKGSSRDLEDSRGRRPIDMVAHYLDADLKDDLYSILGP